MNVSISTNLILCPASIYGSIPLIYSIKLNVFKGNSHLDFKKKTNHNVFVFHVIKSSFSNDYY